MAAAGTHIIARIVATLMAAVLLGACVYDSSDCPPAPAPEPDITIGFTMMSSRAPQTPSRAIDDYTDDDATGAENYIDIAGRDFCFYLLDGSGNYLLDFTPYVTVTMAGGTDNTVIYDCEAAIADPLFEEAFDSDAANVTFYIMAIANGQSMQLGYPYFVRGTPIGQTFPALIGQPMISLPDTGQLLKSNAGGTQHMPMSGIQRFTVSTELLRASTEESPVNISDLDGNKPLSLLRAMGKIELIDKIENTPARHIVGASFYGIMPAGSAVPNLSQWQNGAAYSTANVTEPTHTGGTYSDLTSVAMLSDPDASTLNHNGVPVFSCYVWEYANAWRDPKTVAPYMNVTLNDNKTYRLNFRVYNEDGDQSDFDKILRNHIYRFEIVGIGQQESSLEATWTVCPMSTAEITIPPFE